MVALLGRLQLDAARTPSVSITTKAGIRRSKIALMPEIEGEKERCHDAKGKFIGETPEKTCLERWGLAPQVVSTAGRRMH